MPLDLIKDFAKYEKELTRYLSERRQAYRNSLCRKALCDRLDRLDSSWDMEVGASRGNGRQAANQAQFLAQLSFPLVKQQILTRRAIFTNNFRTDPLWTLKAIGNTPDENAINMQDLLEANNQQTEFRPLVLVPSIDQTVRWGASVVFTEYCATEEKGYRTIGDPVMGSRRVYGVVKATKNAKSYAINPRNYEQDPRTVSCDASDWRGHTERRSLAWFINRVQANPKLYIKENVENIIKRVKQQNELDPNHYDPTQRESRQDFNKVAVNDIFRGQVQFHIEGNEDDQTYYYVEMIGDKIVRMQDNPYDMNLNQYDVLTCEPRYEYWWGNTPAEYSIGNEDRLNLLLGLSIENAIEQMKRYVFYNKNAIDPSLMNRAASNGKIPVDVNKDVALNNLLFTYQIPDTSSNALGDAYARILENDQRVNSTPDLSRPTASGGMSNKTATAASILTNRGDTQDADILERYSYCLMNVGKKHSVILAQFLGNFGPIMIRPSAVDSIRQVQKSQITGNFQFAMDTALQKSYQGEMIRYQNVVTWLLNMVNSGLPVQPNFQPLVKQVLKMGQFVKLDEVLPDQNQMMMPGAVPTQVMPGQELAGPGQDVAPGGLVEAQMSEVAA